MVTTRTEWTIEASRYEDFRESYYLVPINLGLRDPTEQRLRDLQVLPEELSGQFFRLVKREVTTTEWEVA